MPIEFRCTQCGQLLRTADDTAGKQAKCPECGTLAWVPAAGPGEPGQAAPGGAPAAPTGSPFSPGEAPTQPGGPQNPYQAPNQYGQQQPYAMADPMAASRVSGPATALIITGALSIASYLLWLLGRLLQVGVGMAVGGRAGIPLFFAGGIGISFGIVGCILGFVVILGAMKMKNLENYAFAMASAVIAMIPCTPCCLLGFPFGIWALVVLCDEQVRAAFRS